MDTYPSLRARIEHILATYVVCYPETEEEARKFGITTKTSITFGRQLIPRGKTLSVEQLVDLFGVTRREKGWRARSIALVATARSTS